MSFNGDPLAFYGRHLIEEHHASLLKKLPDLDLSREHHDPFDITDNEHIFLPELKVGILGAGIGGLYTALILDSLGIKWEIIEASDRYGGRLSTYRFPNGQKYDYFDEGAMRYPLPKKNPDGTYKNGTMKRLAELIVYPPLNQGLNPLKNTLIPYYFNARQSPGSQPGLYYFNGVYELVSYDDDANKGPFKAHAMGVPSDYIEAGSGAIQGDVINPFVRILVNDMQTGSEDGWNLTKANDSYSVRGYMANKYLPSYSLKLSPKHLSNDVINWCNLLEDSSGGYDRALVEEVFNAFAFAKVGDNDYGDVDWQCFDGGSETLSNKIIEYLNSKGSSIKYGQRVTAIGESKISIGRSSIVQVPTIPAVAVTTNGSTRSVYTHVISTLSLPVLRTIDLNDAGLNVPQRNALRALDYGPAVKVGILFKSNWWTTILNITGGQSYTDLPIRTIVYPSYGVDSDTPSKVLIASYSWTTDAFRLSALALKDNQEVLKELVLRNLAEAHAYYNKGITYEFLLGEFVEMQTKDWNADEYTMGGYAKFSPGEFERLYKSLNSPAANRCLHFAGEAISTRHSWVVGALDSAWRAVYEYLTVTGQTENIKKFKHEWGSNQEWTANSTVPKGAVDHDLLHVHLGLVHKAVLAGTI